MKHLILVKEANQFAKLSEFSKAISSYEKAITIQSDFIEAYYNLGNLYHQMGELDKAVRHYKKVVTLDPDYSKVHPNKTLLVIYFFSKGEINNALETLQAWIKSNPDDALLFNMMGGCYLSLREFKMSIQCYEKALELKPDYAIPQHMINSLKGHTSKSPPKEYVKNLFDDYAERFNDSLVHPIILFKIILLLLIIIDFVIISILDPPSPGMERVTYHGDKSKRRRWVATT